MDLLTFRLDQRPVPAAALRDPKACELLRIWIAEKGLHCSMRVGREREVMNVPEETAWGIVLAETVRHIAKVLQRQGVDPDETIAQIRAALDEELDAGGPVDFAVPALSH